MRVTIPIAYLPVLTIAALALAACAPASDEPQEKTGTETAQAGNAEDPSPDVPLPSEFNRTAWRITSDDGARYTTYLDENGRYRDFRNGDPWQEGTWETDSEDRLCFLPDEEGAALSCWTPDRMDGNDAMIASGQGGTRIKLQQVDYIPPAEADTNS